ncbi:MAG: sulfate ABC transporter substrate-binding protein [Nitrospira sp.]|uniref:Sulfate-binding protein n=1 Tax=Nitrospira defluvii TaxID=330214 RepID=A0ABN7M740_9BACT|nr:sulfate ABC transporter substrate-binding protein [Nitrospira defluvii]MCS6325668.1 sulfate ABC transporter substrate-binding protein [Nitrospira sp.]CAE6786835.1 Sulfate-binding protein [Nitrospira defluvii]
MRTTGHIITTLVLSVLTFWGLFTFPAASSHAAETRDLILAAYSVPKEAYERHIIPAFQRYWKQKTGQDVRVRSSYGASGAQARAIIGGFDADVAVLSLEGDVDQITKAGLITHDWRKAPHGGMISASVVALGVRKGNPKGVKGWEDAARPGVEVLYPNPKTSGGAMWDVIAIYGAGLKLAEQRAGKPVAPEAAATQAVDLLTRIQRNVKVMDKSGRESVTTFERGVGDVIVTYENELLPRVKSGRPYEIIVPAETVWIENPAAVVDTYADRHKARDLAEAFVTFLHGPEAQAAFIELGFRPLDRDVAAPASGTALPQPARLFTIAELGGWDQVSTKLFGPQGLWTKIVEDVSRK